jgi:aryl-alcohol dehydrogenase-like predicted oxidoreductase
MRWVRARGWEITGPAARGKPRASRHGLHRPVLAAQLRPAHTPIEETIATLNDLVRDGKIRYIGLSDTPAWAVAKAAVIADFRGWAPISSNRLIFLLRAAVQQRRSRHV